MCEGREGERKEGREGREKEGREGRRGEGDTIGSHTRCLYQDSITSAIVNKSSDTGQYNRL